MNSLPVFVRTGFYNYPAGWSDDYREYPRSVGSIAYVKSGNADYFAEGGSFKLNKGDILFISPGSTYISYWHSDVEMCALHYSLDMAHMSRGFFDGRRFPIQRVDATESQLDDIIFMHCHADEPDKIMFVLERYYRVLGDVFARLVSVKCPLIDDRIRRAVEYIEAHCTEPLTIEILAEISHMSVSHFFSCFKKSMGVTPIVYKRCMLINRAQRLILESPDLSISEISDLLGFDSETYFRRVFKSITGKSPRSFKQNGGGI